jgi:hypothetical protein
MKYLPLVVNIIIILIISLYRLNLAQGLFWGHLSRYATDWAWVLLIVFFLTGYFGFLYIRKRKKIIGYITLFTSLLGLIIAQLWSPYYWSN